MSFTAPSCNAAWMPSTAAFNEAAGIRLMNWLDTNERPDRAERVIVTRDRSGRAIDDSLLPPVFATLVKTSRWIAPRSMSPRGHGPMIAAWPTEESLAFSATVVRGSTLTVFESDEGPAVLGWATAIGAFNAETGEPTPPLADDRLNEFAALGLESHHLGESPTSGTDRRLVQDHLRSLKDAGLDEDFVVTFCVAVDIHCGPGRVRAHYRAIAVPRG